MYGQGTLNLVGTFELIYFGQYNKIQLEKNGGEEECLIRLDLKLL